MIKTAMALMAALIAGAAGDASTAHSWVFPSAAGWKEYAHLP